MPVALEIEQKIEFDAFGPKPDIRLVIHDLISKMIENEFEIRRLGLLCFLYEIDFIDPLV
ncbi:hypothetical protein D3C86_1996310 [compost metagenome]